MTAIQSAQDRRGSIPAAPSHEAINGDCITVMAQMPAGSVDFILTDPPYLVAYRDRHGRRVANDDNAAWLAPAFEQAHRILKPGGMCASFYGWNHADTFISAWRAAGFRIVGHMVFTKPYASSRRYFGHFHEQAYLLAKGEAPIPHRPLPDVLGWDYTGNRLHPTQKPVQALLPLIEAFTKPGELVLDPFCGSGSTLAAAQKLGRDWIGIELASDHHSTASKRLASPQRQRPAA